jgi:hypothetical protein
MNATWTFVDLRIFHFLQSITVEWKNQENPFSCQVYWRANEENDIIKLKIHYFAFAHYNKFHLLQFSSFLSVNWVISWYIFCIKHFLSISFFHFSFFVQIRKMKLEWVSASSKWGQLLWCNVHIIMIME